MLRQLVKDSLIYSVGLFVSRGFTFLTLPVFARLIGAQDFFAYDIASLVVVLVNMVVGMQSYQGLARFWSEPEYAGRRGSLFFTVFVFSVTNGLLLLPLLWWLRIDLAVLLFQDAKYSGLVMAVACFIPSMAGYQVVQTALRYDGRPAAFTLISFLFSISSLAIGTLAVVWAGWGPEGILAAQAISALIATCLALVILKSKIAFALDRALLFAVLKFSTPLIVTALAVFASTYVNRLILSMNFDGEEIAGYAAISRIASGAMLLMAGVQYAIGPIVYRDHKNADSPAKLAYFFRYFMLLVVLGLLAASLFSDTIVRIIVSDSYQEYAPLLFPVTVGQLFLVFYVFSPGFLIRKRTGLQMLVFLAVALLAIVLNWIMIGEFGITGAAWASFSVGIAFCILHFAWSNAFYPIPFDWLKIIAGVCVVLAVYVAHEHVFQGSIIEIRLLVYLAVSIFLMVVVTRRGELRELFAMLKNAAST